MNFTFDCVKSFVETNTFCDFSAKYGLDSEIVASLCESFAAHIDLPKEKWFKFHPPLEVNVVKPTPVEEKVIAYNDHVVPSAYIEKPPFPVRIKDHSKASSVIRRGYIRTPTPPEQIELNLALLLSKIFCPTMLRDIIFTSVKMLLELLNLMLETNIGVLLACLWFLLR